MQKFKSLFAKLTASPIVSRAFHTFWQAFLAVFTVSVTGLTSQLLAVHNFTDAKALGLALVVSATAAFLSAVKSVIVTGVKVSKA
jgi:hypothetical protein